MSVAVSVIVQLSDPHVVAPGRLLYGQIDTAALLAAAVARVNGLPFAVEAVVVSGDLVNAGQAAEYTHLAALLAPLRVPWYLMPGNHDARETLRQAFPGQPWTPGPLCCARIPVAAGVLLLLDTVRPGEEGGEVAAAQLAWLDAHCPGEGAAFLFLHHPPFATGIAGMDAIACAGGALLAAWLDAHPQVVALTCGHVHRPVFTSFAGRPACIAPSVAHQVALELDGTPEALAWSLEPPGFLVHRWAAGAPPVTHLLSSIAAPVQYYA